MNQLSTRKPIWKWWYTGCWTQQLYIIITILVGLLISFVTGVFFLSTVKAFKEKGKDILEKYKIQIILAIVSSFLISFAINNMILTWYCNKGFSGGKNLLLTLVMYFIVLSSVNVLVNWIIQYALLKEVTTELNLKLI